MADGARCNGVIAGHHNDPDAGRLAVPYRLGNVGARRIGEGYEADEIQTFEGRRIRVSGFLAGAGEHAKAMASELTDAPQPFASRCVIQGNVAFAGGDMFRRCEHGFGRALHREK